MPNPPTQYLGDKGFIGIAKETTLGTPVNSTEWFQIKSETLETDPGIVLIDEIRQTRAGHQDKVLGEQKSQGNIVVNLRPTNGARMTAALFGSDSVANSSNVYTHTLTALDTGLPSITVEKAWASLKSWQLAGALVNKGTYKFTTGAAVEATYEVIGMSQALITPSTPTWTQDQPYSLPDIAVLVNAYNSAPAVINYVTEATLEVDNGVKTSYEFGATGGGQPTYPAFIYGGTRKVTGTLVARITANTYYTDAIAGTQLAVTISATKSASLVTNFFMPKVVLGKPSIPIVMGEVIKQTLPFTALYDDVSGYDIVATVVNGVSTNYFP